MVCSCAELQGFSCYSGWKEACQGVAHDFNNIETRAAIKFFFLQGKAQKENHAILTETLEEHAPSYATVKKLGGLQKLEQRAKKFIELRGENVE